MATKKPRLSEMIYGAVGRKDAFGGLGGSPGLRIKTAPGMPLTSEQKKLLLLAEMGKREHFSSFWGRPVPAPAPRYKREKRWT